jgi:hypothetical protein
LCSLKMIDINILHDILLLLECVVLFFLQWNV